MSNKLLRAKKLDTVVRRFAIVMVFFYIICLIGAMRSWDIENMMNYIALGVLWYLVYMLQRRILVIQTIYEYEHERIIQLLQTRIQTRDENNVHNQ